MIPKIVEEIKDRYSLDVVVEFLDDLKLLGFKYATNLGFSFAIEDCNVDFDVKSRIKEVEEKDLQLQENYLQGLITEKEKINISTEMWNDFASDLADEAWEKLDKNNAVYEMVESGANGGKIQARQVLTIKGIVKDSRGNSIPLPIKGNYRDGLNAFEYFVAANGGRKGIADRSLRTSSSGYLTRKLVDVAHDVIIRLEDCGYDGEGLLIRKSDDRRISFEKRIFGRVVTKDIKNSKGELLVAKNSHISKEIAEKMVNEGIEEVYVRTPVLCKSPLGMCKKCYGANLENGNEIEMGKAVGVIAAQSIGEPGTQMTMRTFHKGGVQTTDITQGLPRIEELFEARSPKAEAEISTIYGKVHIEKAEDDSATILIVGEKRVVKDIVISDMKNVLVTDGAKIKAGQVIYIDSEGMEKQSPFDGIANIEGGILTLTGALKAEESVSVLPNVEILVNEGEEIEAGRQLVAGAVDPKKLAEVAGLEAAQKYILDEVQKVFNEQAVSIDDIHIEVIIRQMARLGRVLDSGDTEYLVGSMINRFVSDVKNELLLEQGKMKALISPKLLGIKASALYTESFLSALSFQEQVRVSTNSAILGKTDYLRGMKENVIIGRRIPSGEDATLENINNFEEIKI